MRTAKILMTVLLLGAPNLADAQAKPPAATGAPEILSGTAQAKSATSAVSALLEIRMPRYSSDFDRTTIETALKMGGYPRFLTTLRSSPEVGQVKLGDLAPVAIKYARERTSMAGRTLVLVADRPLFFVGSTKPNAPPKAGYEVAVIELQLDGAGRGKGSMAAAARVKPDGDGGVLLDDYAEALVEIVNVTRKPLN